MVANYSLREGMQVQVETEEYICNRTKELKNRVFNIPQNILNHINHAVGGLMGNHADGLMRAKKLLSDKTVTYGQLKRIIQAKNIIFSRMILFKPFYFFFSIK